MADLLVYTAVFCVMTLIDNTAAFLLILRSRWKIYPMHA